MASQSSSGTPAEPTFQTIPKASTKASASGSDSSTSSTSCPSPARASAARRTPSTQDSSIGTSTGGVVVIPMRSRPGSSRAATDHGRAGGGALYQPSGSGRPMTSSTAAVSATVRVTAPLVAKPSSSLTPFGTRLRLGFNPTSPLHDAGMRMEPPPSLAWAIGAMPEATAAPAPPLDPPGVCSGSHGLRVTPWASLSVYETVPNSGELVMPRGMKPAPMKRCTTKSVAVLGAAEAPRDPYVVGQPSTRLRSLIGSGTPWNGGSSSPDARVTA